MDATINPWWEGELAGGVFVDRRLGQRLRNLIERAAEFVAEVLASVEMVQRSLRAQ